MEALAVKLTQQEGELIQEKYEVKKLATYLKQVTWCTNSSFPSSIDIVIANIYCYVPNLPNSLWLLDAFMIVDVNF